MRAWALGALAAALVPLAWACAGEPAEDMAVSCSAEEPHECPSPEGVILGCCPDSHPICSADGTQCFEWGSTGGGGSPSGGGGAPSGGGGSPSGGGGSPSGGGGAPSGGGGSPSGGGGSPSGGGGSPSGGGGSPSGGTGGTGGGGTGGGGTGGTGGSSCVDKGFEPNETESAATALGTINDCDGSGSTASGKLDGSSDVDYYSFFGTDQAGCVVGPVASTTAKVRLCLFADCASAKVSCSSGTPSTSPGGRPGCCVPAGGKVDLSLDCTGWTDDATIYVRVDQGAANACTAYSVDYHY
ncbi:MAG: hypothetical protein IT375_07000 [Polyangiaceae bacterium]|nr:hypothetical protein [Polyangiaceae bacterium]